MNHYQQRNDYLESKINRLDKEERLLSQKVDLDDKVALKKLVLMLKIKNDQLLREGVQIPNKNR